MGTTTAVIRAREVVRALSRIPIIALTAHSMKGDCERCLAAGMDAFVTKPIRASELFEAIESTCSATLQVEPITIIKNGQLL